MDIDLEEAEALFQADQSLRQGNNGDSTQRTVSQNDNDGRDDRDERKSKKKKHGRSRSRSSKKQSKKHRSRSRSDSGKKKHKHRSRSSKKDKKDKKRSSKSRERNTSSTVPPAQQPQIPLDQLRLNPQDLLELKKKELENQLERLNKEAEEAAREDLTVMMYQIPSRADEKDIWVFLTKCCGCSKVRDIKLIRDQKTKRFKGVAYAEFYTKEDIDKALSSDTKPFVYRGEEVPMSEVRVQHSHAEKNRAAYAAKLLKQQKADALRDQLARLQEGPVKIFVSGLSGKLATITSQEIKDIFQQFGEIDNVEMPLNPTGGNLGFCYILFKNRNEAQEAITKMNGYQMQDQKLTCTLIPATPILATSHQSLNAYTFQQQQPQDYNDRIDLDQNENSIYLHTAQKRLELMKKLAGNSVNIPGLDNQVNPQLIHQSSGSSSSYLPIPGIANLPSLNIAQNQLVQNNFIAGNRPPTSLVPTNFIVLVNMFSQKESENEPSFFADLKEDVGEECKKFGEVTDVFVAVKSPCGSVFVLFTNQKSAVDCAKAMDGRNFNQRPIACYCISEDTLQDELQKNL